MNSPWANGDDPLPSNIHDLINEIKLHAAARRRDALTHPAGHNCDGCKIRRSDQNRAATRKLAS